MDGDEESLKRLNETCMYNPKLLKKSDDGAKRKLYTVSFVAFGFLITEVIMGLISGSLAILSDAAHMFSDIFGFAISIVAITISTRKSTKAFSFGYQRAEILGALGKKNILLTILK